MRITSFIIVIVMLVSAVACGSPAPPSVASDSIHKGPWADVRAFKDATHPAGNIQTAVNSGAKTVRVPAGVYTISGPLTIPPGVDVIGENWLDTIIRAGNPIGSGDAIGMVILNGSSTIENIQIDGNCTFDTSARPYRINPDGADIGILIYNSSHNVVRNCLVKHTRVVSIYAVAHHADITDTVQDNLIENNIVENYDFVYGGEGIGGNGILVRARFAGDDAVDYGDFLSFSTYQPYAAKCTGNKILNNIVSGGILPIQINTGNKNSVIGNTVSNTTGSGTEVEPFSSHNIVSKNTYNNCAGAGVSVAIGSSSNIVDHNIFNGVGAVYNFVVGIFFNANNNIIDANIFDSLFDRYTGVEPRAPGSAIRISQYTKGNQIINNNIKGYQIGIYAPTTMYPGALTVASPAYYLTGYQDTFISGNRITGAYALSAATGTRLSMPQNTLYGIYLHKNTDYDKSDQPGIIAWTGIEANENKVSGVEYPYAVIETAPVATPPLKFTGIIFRNNSASDCTSGAGYPNMPIRQNLLNDSYIGVNNSWQFKKKYDPTYFKWSYMLVGVGDKFTITDSNFYVGTPYEYIYNGVEFSPLMRDQIVSTGSEGDYTLVWGETPPTFLYTSVLTANHTVVLNIAAAVRGAKFKIVRTSTATGAFSITVAGVKTLSVINQWCEFEFDGAAWQLVAAGSL